LAGSIDHFRQDGVTPQISIIYLLLRNQSSSRNALFVKNPSKDGALSFTHAANLVAAMTQLLNKRDETRRVI
jgi:hypothetical protein